MTNKYDILLGEDLDLQEDAVTHDLIEGESTKQHQQLLLICVKGSFKENPDTGVGLINFLEDEETAGMFSEIKQQFNADGMVINSMGLNDEDKLLIDAFYK